MNKGVKGVEISKKEGFLKKINPVWVILCIVAGICLMIYSGKDKDVEGSGQTISGFETGDPSAYEELVENKVKEICSSIEGVSDVNVAVTLAGGYRAVYASNSHNTSSGYKSEIVTTGSGSSEKPLMIGYEYPEISGIGIVCKGGERADIKKRIISLVSSTFGVSTNKIEVVGG